MSTLDPALAIAVPLIARFEGFSAAPYQDVGGTYTIGYGFTYTPDGARVTAMTPHLTQTTAQAWLATFAGKTLSVVRQMVHVTITDNQAAALCSFAFNEGTGALRTSALMDRLNAREPMTEVAACFASWVYAGGRYSQGLANRRAMEAALFLKADGVAAASATKPENIPSLSTADDLNAAELDRIDEGAA